MSIRFVTDSAGIEIGLQEISEATFAYWTSQGRTHREVVDFVCEKNEEWVETVELGWNKVIGTDMKDIVRNVNNLLKRLFSGTTDNIPFHSNKNFLGNYYGDGYASRKIIDCLQLINESKYED